MDPAGPSACVLQCLSICSQTLQQLNAIQRSLEAPIQALATLQNETKLILKSLSTCNGLFYDFDKDVASSLDSDPQLRHSFDGTFKPCNTIFSTLTKQLTLFAAKNARTDADAQRTFKQQLSLVRTLRSAMTMAVSALDQYVPS